MTMRITQDDRRNASERVVALVTMSLSRDGEVGWDVPYDGAFEELERLDHDQVELTAVMAVAWLQSTLLCWAENMLEDETGENDAAPEAVVDRALQALRIMAVVSAKHYVNGDDPPPAA